MSLVLVTPPTDLPVSLDEAKEYLRVSFPDEDETIERMLRAATEKLDGRDGLLGRCLRPQGWRYVLDGFPSEITLPLPPCISVEGVTYTDAAGVLQTLDPAAYQVIGLGGGEFAKIRPANGTSWPATRAVPECVGITFVAGYTTTDSPNVDTLPERLRAAILLHLGILYDHRDEAPALPTSYHELIHDFRTWRL